MIFWSSGKRPHSVVLRVAYESFFLVSDLLSLRPLFSNFQRWSLSRASTVPFVGCATACNQTKELFFTQSQDIWQKYFPSSLYVTLIISRENSSRRRAFGHLLVTWCSLIVYLMVLFWRVSFSNSHVNLKENQQSDLVNTEQCRLTLEVSEAVTMLGFAWI